MEMAMLKLCDLDMFGKRDNQHELILHSVAYIHRWVRSSLV